jgi:hypothetical protein
MITIDDFTRMPEGTVATLEGRVVRCPACGRNGVVQRPESDAACCVHVEESEIHCDGMRTDPTDCCRLPQ